MKRQDKVRVGVLAMLAAWMLFLSSAGAAEWISGLSDGTTGWLKEVALKLNSDEYRAMFVNDPRTPQESVMRFLKRAARAYDAKNPAMVGSFIDKAVGVLKTGVSKHYYSEADIAQIVSFIEEAAPKGES